MLNEVENHLKICFAAVVFDLAVTVRNDHTIAVLPTGQGGSQEYLLFQRWTTEMTLRCVGLFFLAGSLGKTIEMCAPVGNT